MTESPQPTDPDPERAAPAPPPRARGSRLASLVWGGLVVLLLAGVAWYIHSRSAQEQRSGRGNIASVSVVTAPVQQGDLPVTLNALGTVTPLATVTVKTQIAGRLVAIGFQEGQIVKAGDFLAQVDPRPYQIALEQAQGQLTRDTALLHDARIDLARYRTLAAEDSIPQQQLDTQEYLVRQYEGTVKSDEAMRDNARLNLEYCHIVAPVSGRVGLRQVDQGNYVQTSDPNGVVLITQLQPISVIFTLPEDNVPTVIKRLGTGSALPVTAYDRALTTKLATGTLVTIDNQIDTTTGTVRLRARFDNRDNRLFPNQFVTTLLLVDTLKNATLVPSAAVQRGAPGTFVYVVNGERVVNLRPVKLGPTDGERVAVESGVTPGEQVVVDGADKLKDGAKVTLASDQPRAPGGSDRASSDNQRRSRKK
ncbi:MAG TPA: MdtA/MuxA family multidrug efflux RND transporter periplasmic adaptor subunit [Methylomirabilota bacterium]|nr:MdtA/MuxA family multidrug efflux RND transporter periplasmic adaptor subunit [Methylomirabilota bacterium]